MTLGNPHWARYMWPKAQEAAASYAALAKKHGLDPGGMAMAFVMTRPWTGSTIIGASTSPAIPARVACPGART